MTASDHLKHHTGSLGGDQQLKRFSPAARIEENAPRGYMIGDKKGNWYFAPSVEAALAQKTRECEELQKLKAWADAAIEKKNAALVDIAETNRLFARKLVEQGTQVEQLRRQVAEHEQNLRKSYRAGFEDCRNKALYIVDEHEGFSDRIEAATPEVSC